MELRQILCVRHGLKRERRGEEEKSQKEGENSWTAGGEVLSCAGLMGFMDICVRDQDASRIRYEGDI